MKLDGNIVDIDNGYVSGKKCGVYASLDAPATTVVTTGGTYYPILGTFTNNPIEDFTTTADPAIKYVGSKTQWFEIDWHATVKTNHASCTVKIGIKKNGSLVTSSQMGTLCKTAGDLYSMSGTCVVELATNETIQLVTTADSNGDQVTTEYFQTTINEFFD